MNERDKTLTQDTMVTQDNNGVISQSGLARKLWGQVMSKVHSGLASAKFNDSKYVERR